MQTSGWKIWLQKLIPFPQKGQRDLVLEYKRLTQKSAERIIQKLGWFVCVGKAYIQKAPLLSLGISHPGRGSPFWNSWGPRCQNLREQKVKRHAYHIRACASSSLQNSVLPPPSLEVENYFCKDCNLIHCSRRRRVCTAKGKWGEREIETWVKKILPPAQSPLDFTWMTEIQLSPEEPMAMTLLYTCHCSTGNWLMKLDLPQAKKNRLVAEAGLRDSEVVCTCWVQIWTKGVVSFLILANFKACKEN